MDFEQFVRTESAALLGAAGLVTGDRHEAQDVVQTVLARLGLRWGSVQALDNPSAYARRAVVNEALSWRRRRRTSPSAEVPEHADPHDASTDAASRAAVVALLRPLPTRQRAVLVLRYVYDLDVAATAAELSISEGTVKSTTSRALAALRLSPPSREGARDGTAYRG